MPCSQTLVYMPNSCVCSIVILVLPNRLQRQLAHAGEEGRSEASDSVPACFGWEAISAASLGAAACDVSEGFVPPACTTMGSRNPTLACQPPVARR